MMVVKGAETLNIDGIRVPTDITREDQLLCLFRNRVTAFLCTLNWPMRFWPHWFIIAPKGLYVPDYGRIWTIWGTLPCGCNERSAMTLCIQFSLAWQQAGFGMNTPSHQLQYKYRETTEDIWKRIASWVTGLHYLPPPSPGTHFFACGALKTMYNSHSAKKNLLLPKKFTFWNVIQWFPFEHFQWCLLGNRSRSGLPPPENATLVDMSRKRYHTTCSTDSAKEAPGVSVGTWYSDLLMYMYDQFCWPPGPRPPPLRSVWSKLITFSGSSLLRSSQQLASNLSLKYPKSLQGWRISIGSELSDLPRMAGIMP